MSPEDKEELQKCKDSPLYFYNKYWRREGQREITESEYEAFMEQLKRPYGWKRRRPCN